MGEFLSKWNEYLQYFSSDRKDIYWEEEYVKLYETECDRAVCFVYREGNNIMLFPFLVREHNIDGKIYKDFETAYGYGGAIFNVSDRIFITKAWQSFERACRDNSYFAGFIRFHPLLQNYSGWELETGRLLKDRLTVKINLTLSEEELWEQQIHFKHRNSIRKALKNGLEFSVDENFDTLPVFKGLYTTTMERLQAQDFYFFGDDYFSALKNNLKNSFIGNVFYESKVIASAIFFYSGVYGHYHLSGSNREYLNLCPNNLLLFGAMKYLKSKGVEYFHLGGGTSSDEHDPLLLFKQRFSKEYSDFYIGKLIFNPQRYDEICCKWEQNFPDKKEMYNNVLLKYRY